MTRTKVRWCWRLAAFALLVQGGSGWGSPLPPVVRGAVSANGHFLVVSSFDLGEVVDGGGQRIKGQTFEINTVETFLNAKDRLNAPNVFYSGLGWAVKTKFDEAHLTYWPIVSNDVATLVLVGVTIAQPAIPVLKIYRQKGLDGVLVRSFAITDLWSEKEIYPRGDKIIMDKGYTPQWFATGSFAFDRTGEHLMYRRANGETLLIGLKDGDVVAAPH